MNPDDQNNKYGETLNQDLSRPKAHVNAMPPISLQTDLTQPDGNRKSSF